MANFDWQKEAEQWGPATESPLPTAYFGNDVGPRQSLDPHLFDENDQLRPDVRNLVLTTITRYLRTLGFRKIGKWLKVWITGSAAGYQWSTDFDLDLMLGWDEEEFDQANPDWQGISEHFLARYLNDQLQEELWSELTEVPVNGATYEMTFFFNEGTGGDVMNIHPYTAYDVTANDWVLHPSTDRIAYRENFPSEWFDATARDQRKAADLSTRYNALRDTLAGAEANSPAYINAENSLRLVTAQASALYDDIHKGRQLAFQGGGTGNLDWHNFRWQQSLRLGTASALSTMRGLRRAAQDASDEQLYGGTIASHDEALTRAMMVNRSRRDR